MSNCTALRELNSCLCSYQFPHRYLMNLEREQVSKALVREQVSEVNTVLTEQGCDKLTLPVCIYWSSAGFPSPSLGISCHPWSGTYRKGFPQSLVAVSCACLQAAREKRQGPFRQGTSSGTRAGRKVVIPISIYRKEFIMYNSGSKYTTELTKSKLNKKPRIIKLIKPYN